MLTTLFLVAVAAAALATVALLHAFTLRLLGRRVTSLETFAAKLMPKVYTDGSAAWLMLRREDRDLVIVALRAEGERLLSAGGSPPPEIIANGTRMRALADELERRA